LEAFEFVTQQFNSFEFYKVNRILYGVGLVVDGKFRGQGIATEILKARVPLMKALRLNVTTTIFTGICSQKSAKSAKFEENFSISFSDLQKQFPTMNFSHANTTHCKTLSLKIE
jgi:RimJ/RimL family protein N-acetyltransferase